jgi:hypothetical protein
MKNQIYKLNHFLITTAAFLRWKDWGPSKIPIFCTILAYVGLANHDLSPRFAASFIFFLFFATVHSALGYVANNFGDQHIDKAQGKDNPFNSCSLIKSTSFLSILFSLAFLSGLPFIQRKYFVFLWGTWAFFALAYSLKPIRLKEQGKWGLAVSAIAQWTLPVMITFAAFDRFGKMDMIAFIFANTVSGATLEIAHQRWDRLRDLQTGTKTFGTQISEEKLGRLYFASLLMDKMAIGVVIVTVITGIYITFPGVNALIAGIPLAVAYTVLTVFAMNEMSKQKTNSQFLDPYYSQGKSANKLLHETLPNLLIPAYLLFLITLAQPVNSILLVVFLYWRIVLGHADWRWPFKALRSCFLK